MGGWKLTTGWQLTIGKGRIIALVVELCLLLTLLNYWLPSAKGELPDPYDSHRPSIIIPISYNDLYNVLVFILYVMNMACPDS